MSTASHQARETIKQEKKAGTLINASGRGSTRSAIFLDNGSVIASPFSVNKLISDIAKANAREPYPKRANETETVRVYEAITIDNSQFDDSEEELNEEESEVLP